MLNLQYIVDGKNAGGLYLIVENICSVRSEEVGFKASGEPRYGVFICMTNGVEYEIADSITEVLDALNKYFKKI